jgi:hypothetical protein
MSCKRASVFIGALLGNLEGVRLPGLLRDEKSISGLLSCNRRPLRFKAWGPFGTLPATPRNSQSTELADELPIVGVSGSIISESKKSVNIRIRIMHSLHLPVFKQNSTRNSKNIWRFQIEFCKSYK